VLWEDKVRHCLTERYAGVPMLKMPEDLRVYEHILWLARVEVVVELGTHAGGTALWFRDRLRTLASYGHIRSPKVVAVGLDIGPATSMLAGASPDYASEITLVEGDVTDQAVADRVHDLVPAGSSCLVIDDSAHTHETTTAALAYYSDLVQPGGFFVVEDGCVDVEEMRVEAEWPRGVIPAIHEFLESPEGSSFEQRRDLELYGLTCHIEGYLQRRG